MLLPNLDNYMLALGGLYFNTYVQHYICVYSNKHCTLKMKHRKQCEMVFVTHNDLIQLYLVFQNHKDEI